MVVRTTSSPGPRARTSWVVFGSRKWAMAWPRMTPSGTKGRDGGSSGVEDQVFGEAAHGAAAPGVDADQVDRPGHGVALPGVLQHGEDFEGGRKRRDPAAQERVAADGLHLALGVGEAVVVPG